MADNYLERKMEDYRRSIANGESHMSSKRKASQIKEGYIQIKFPPRRVFVTGGASGIGRAIVESFRRTGCKVAFCDTDTIAGRNVSQSTGSQFHPLDIADSIKLTTALDYVARNWGDIDVIINNAGIFRYTPLTTTSVEEFDRIMAVNVRPIWITAGWLMKRRKETVNPYGGRIINICSTRQSMSEPDTEAYSASKGAVYSMTHALMASFSGTGVTVNSISPGWIHTTDTPLTETDHTQHPSGRVGNPEDIARICLFLSSPDADFINGENIVADGGMTRKMIYAD